MAETTEKVRTPLEEATYNKLNKSVGEGRIVRIVGPVVDVKFDDKVPSIYTALLVDDDTPIGRVKTVLEVESQLANDVVRTVAMSSTDPAARASRQGHRAPHDDARWSLDPWARLERNGRARRR